MWGSEQHTAFKTLKKELSSCPALSHFHDDWKIEVQTDASQIGLGAVLLHHYPTGQEHIVVYASRKLPEMERKYSSNELECLAAVCSVDEKVSHFLYGCHFIIVANNTAMSWMFQKQQLKHKCLQDGF